MKNLAFSEAEQKAIQKKVNLLKNKLSTKIRLVAFYFRAIFCLSYQIWKKIDLGVEWKVCQLTNIGPRK